MPITLTQGEKKIENKNNIAWKRFQTAGSAWDPWPPRVFILHFCPQGKRLCRYGPVSLGKLDAACACAHPPPCPTRRPTDPEPPATPGVGQRRGQRKTRLNYSPGDGWGKEDKETSCPEAGRGTRGQQRRREPDQGLRT